MTTRRLAYVLAGAIVAVASSGCAGASTADAEAKTKLPTAAFPSESADTPITAPSQLLIDSLECGPDSQGVNVSSGA
jgi:hypothetical protein